MPVRIFISHGRYADKAWWTDSDPSDPFDALNEWTECGNEARNNIDRYIQSWKTEMDTLLVFGSLFSAIVTAFVIESYTWLQADSTDTTVLLLLQISAQLANQSQEIAQLPSYAPTASQIAINVCWFASLILSLTAILLAIMIKQWLSEYSWPTGTISARETMAMRQIRVDSLYDWHLSTIVDWLPLLMISSLFLFFGGLATMLFTLNTVVASVAAGFVSISLIVFLTTSALPTFAPECSYRSAQSYIFFLVVSPVMEMFSKVPKAWEHVNSQTRVRMAQVEPRALIWILMNICPWKPSLYPQVSACARSLNRTIAPRAVCDLFRVSISHEHVQFTKEQARRWQLRIGTDEFEKTCLLLADGAKSMSSDWEKLQPDDVIDYVKTLSLFFSLFSPEYLQRGRWSYEEYPSEVFRKGLEIMVDIVIGDRLPRHLSNERQRELKVFVREQLDVMSNFEWPKRTEGQTVKDYVPGLFPPVVNAAVCLQTTKSSDPEEFIFLTTFALSLTRRMKQEQMMDAQSYFITLINSMTDFVVANTGGTSVALPRQAISRWIGMWFAPLSSKSSRNEDATMPNTTNSAMQIAMGSLLGSLHRAESLDAGLWVGHEIHRDRLRMGFGDVKDLSEAYINSAVYTSQTKDPWSKEHKTRWNTELTQNEVHRVIQVLLKALRTDPNHVYIRILCQTLPTLDFFSAPSYEGTLCLLDFFQPTFNIDVVASIAECLAEMFGAQLSLYRDRTKNLQFSMRLQKVLTVISSIAFSEVNMRRPLAIIFNTILESLSVIDGEDFPGISRLRTQSINLLKQLQGLITAWTQGSDKHNISPYKPIVYGWIRSLERSVDKGGMIFFAQNPDCETINHELHVFLQLLEREGLVSESGPDSEVGTVFRKLKEWSLVVI